MLPEIIRVMLPEMSSQVCAKWSSVARKFIPAISYHPYSRFSNDVTKSETKKLLILLSFYFHEELLNTFIYTNFRFERVVRFAIEYV